jgi:hypothetical protein
MCAFPQPTSLICTANRKHAGRCFPGFQHFPRPYTPVTFVEITADCHRLYIQTPSANDRTAQPRAHFPHLFAHGENARTAAHLQTLAAIIFSACSGAGRPDTGGRRRSPLPPVPPCLLCPATPHLVSCSRRPANWDFFRRRLATLARF